MVSYALNVGVPRVFVSLFPVMMNLIGLYVLELMCNCLPNNLRLAEVFQYSICVCVKHKYSSYCKQCFISCSEMAQGCARTNIQQAPPCGDGRQPLHDGDSFYHPD